MEGPHFAYTLVSGVVSKSCWYAHVWVVTGHAVLISGFFPVSLRLISLHFLNEDTENIANFFW